MISKQEEIKAKIKELQQELLQDVVADIELFQLGNQQVIKTQSIIDKVNLDYKTIAEILRQNGYINRNITIDYWELPKE